MKFISVRIIVFLFLCITSLCSCYTQKQISRFSANRVELGFNKEDFINKFGKPFSQSVSYNSENKMEEQLYYKEELYLGMWYIVTSIFTFQDSKLVKQEIKEEKMFERCNCKKQ
ncbi:hypothetical protein [Bacteroides sp. 41_26]|uniref:hypothetical protein n=1 Tax=Bacteroides sp. 41_26 TaxID=1896973 RepID=UPI00259CAC64|nr:hypothetical protein [Bacteroides sp. 41_26]